MFKQGTPSAYLDNGIGKVIYRPEALSKPCIYCLLDTFPSPNVSPSMQAVTRSSASAATSHQAPDQMNEIRQNDQMFSPLATSASIISIIGTRSLTLVFHFIKRNHLATEE